MCCVLLKLAVYWISKICHLRSAMWCKYCSSDRASQGVSSTVQITSHSFTSYFLSHKNPTTPQRCNMQTGLTCLSAVWFHSKFGLPSPFWRPYAFKPQANKGGKTLLLYQSQAQLIFQALLGWKLLSHTEGQTRKKPHCCLVTSCNSLSLMGHNAANDQRPTERQQLWCFLK